jgi:tetratricopeptide (TPR) repeat protein
MTAPENDKVNAADTIASIARKLAKLDGVQPSYLKALLGFAVSLRPDDATTCELLLTLASRLGSDHEDDAALEALNRAMATGGRTPQQTARIRIGRGQLHYNEGRTTEAVADFSGVLSFENLPIELAAAALEGRWKCNEELGNAAAVIHDMLTAIEIGKLSARNAAVSLHNYGVRKNMRGNTRLAAEYFDAVIRLGEPDQWVVANALGNRGCHFADISDYDTAAMFFKASLACQVEDSDVLARSTYNLGNLRWIQKAYEAAIPLLTAALSNDECPDSTIISARCKRGLCFAHVGRKEEAISDLDFCLRWLREGSRIGQHEHLFVGILAAELGRHDDAIDCFQRLVSRTDADAEYHNRAIWGLGDSLIAIGRRDEGLERLHHARASFMDLRRNDLVRLIDESIAKTDGEQAG